MAIFLKKMSSFWQFFDSQMAIFRRVSAEPKRGRKRLDTSQAPTQEVPPANDTILQELCRLTAEVAMLKSQPRPSQKGPSSQDPLMCLRSQYHLQCWLSCKQDCCQVFFLTIYNILRLKVRVKNLMSRQSLPTQRGRKL